MLAISIKLRRPHEERHFSEARTVRNRQYVRAETQIWERWACIRGRRTQHRVFLSFWEDRDYIRVRLKQAYIISSSRTIVN